MVVLYRSASLITVPQNVSDKRVYLKKITDPNDTLVSRRVGYLAYTAQFDTMQRKQQSVAFFLKAEFCVALVRSLLTYVVLYAVQG